MLLSGICSIFNSFHISLMTYLLLHKYTLYGSVSVIHFSFQFKKCPTQSHLVNTRRLLLGYILYLFLSHFFLPNSLYISLYLFLLMVQKPWFFQYLKLNFLFYLLSKIFHTSTSLSSKAQIWSSFVQIFLFAFLWTVYGRSNCVFQNFFKSWIKPRVN